MKKGSFIITTEMLLWAIPRLILLIVVVFAMFFVTGSYVHREIDITDIEAGTLITRLFYSPNCLVYADGVREYPGIIDMKRFKEVIEEDEEDKEKNRLEKCLHRTGLSARLILYDLNGNELAKNFINEEEFKIDKPFCKFEEYNCVEEQKYVLVYDDGNLISGFLNIFMVIK